MQKLYNPYFYSVLGAFLFLLLTTSCGGDSKNEIIHEDLPGLWELKETIYNPINNEVPAGEGEENNESEGEENTATEGEGDSTDSGAPSGAPALDAEPGEEDGSQVYPDEEGQQPYLRLGTNNFDFFEVSSTDTLFHHADRPYSNSSTEINFDIASTSLLTVGYSIERKTLYLIRLTEQFEIVHIFEKMSSDPFIEEEEEDGEVPELPENNCSANHNPEAVPGSTANPYLLTLGKDTTVHLSPTSADNGYEARFYMEVKTAKPYRISISGFSSDSAFTNVLSPFRYFELSASEAYASEYHLFTPLRINEEDAAGKFADVYPVTSCLYVKLFSYVDDLSVRLRVEPLFEEEEEAADEGEEAADEGEEAGTPEA